MFTDSAYKTLPVQGPNLAMIPQPGLGYSYVSHAGINVNYIYITI